MPEVPRKLRESSEIPKDHSEVGMRQDAQEVGKGSLSNILSRAKTRNREGDEKSISASRALQRIKKEGITHETLPLLAEHVSAFNLESSDLLKLSDFVGHLLLEWEPSYHPLIRKVQEDLRSAGEQTNI